MTAPRKVCRPAGRAQAPLALRGGLEGSDRIEQIQATIRACLRPGLSDEDARDAVNEALARVRPPFEGHSDAFLERLADALFGMEAELASHGLETRLTVQEEGVRIYRALAARSPKAFLRILANRLGSISGDLSLAGRGEACRAAKHEAIDILRSLEASHPGAFACELRWQLRGLVDHSPVSAAILPVHEEIVSLQRGLAASDPTPHQRLHLADDLRSFGEARHRVRPGEGALAALQEALSICRALAAEQMARLATRAPHHDRKEWVMDWLNRSLQALGRSLSKLQQHDDALAALHEAICLQRALRDCHLAGENDDLPQTLLALGEALSAAGQPALALRVTQEAVEFQRALVASQPTEYLRSLAGSLEKLGDLWLRLGQSEQALVAVREAVSLRDSVPQEGKASTNHSLSILSQMLTQLGRRNEAADVLEEGVGVLRLRAAEQPELYRSALLDGLRDLTRARLKAAQPERALVVAEEAADLARHQARALLSSAPGEHQDHQREHQWFLHFYQSFASLRDVHAARKQPRKALAVVEEEAGFFRALAERSSHWRFALAFSLSRLSTEQTRMGQRQKALATAQEVTSIYRSLASREPKDFLPLLVESLSDLGRRHHRLGQRDQTLAAIDEALKLSEPLAIDEPQWASWRERLDKAWQSIAISGER